MTLNTKPRVSYPEPWTLWPPVNHSNHRRLTFNPRTQNPEPQTVYACQPRLFILFPWTLNPKSQFLISRFEITNLELLVTSAAQQSPGSSTPTPAPTPTPTIPTPTPSQTPAPAYAPIDDFPAGTAALFPMSTPSAAPAGDLCRHNQVNYHLHEHRLQRPTF